MRRGGEKAKKQRKEVGEHEERWRESKEVEERGGVWMEVRRRY